MPIINFDAALGSHQRALLIEARRAQLLASNVANADTPNYKARDIDFRAALQQAGGGAGLALAADNARHIQPAGAAGGVGGIEAQYRVPNQSSLDGNTVDLQMEQSAFADNALRYEATLKFLGGRFKGLLTAIRGS